MNDIVWTEIFEGLIDGFGDVELVEPGGGGYLGCTATGEIIQDRDLVSAPEQFLADMRADKTGATGNQDLPTHPLAPKERNENAGIITAPGYSF